MALHRDDREAPDRRRVLRRPCGDAEPLPETHPAIDVEVLRLAADHDDRAVAGPGEPRRDAGGTDPDEPLVRAERGDDPPDRAALLDHLARALLRDPGPQIPKPGQLGVAGRAIEPARNALDVAADAASSDLDEERDPRVRRGPARLLDREPDARRRAELPGRDREGRNAEPDRERRIEAGLNMGSRLGGCHPADVDLPHLDAFRDVLRLRLAGRRRGRPRGRRGDGPRGQRDRCQRPERTVRSENGSAEQASQETGERRRTDQDPTPHRAAV
jgi:hypothetical protein